MMENLKIEGTLEALEIPKCGLLVFRLGGSHRAEVMERVAETIKGLLEARGITTPFMVLGPEVDLHVVDLDLQERVERLEEAVFPPE